MGAVVDNKTKPTNVNVDDFIKTAAERRQPEARQLLALMSEVTGERPAMWGPTMIGFGTYRYKSPKTGREGDWLRVGFSPRKPALVLYGLIFYDENEPNNKLLEKLGPHKRGKGCLYVTKLSDVDMSVLRQMIHNAYFHES